MVETTETKVDNELKSRIEVKQVAEAIQSMLLDEETKKKIRDQPPVPDPVTEDLAEPQILFLGTISMKPT